MTCKVSDDERERSRDNSRGQQPAHMAQSLRELLPGFAVAYERETIVFELCKRVTSE